MKSLFVPVFDTLNGGPAQAWVCQVDHCGKPTRTRIGMVMHLKRIHRIEVQGNLFDNKTKGNS